MLDPRPPVDPSRLAWITVGGCLGALSLGLLLQMLSMPVGLWFTEVFGLLAVAWALTRWSGRAPARYVRLTWPGLPAVLFAAGLGIANYVGLAIPLQGLSRSLFPPDWLESFDPTRAILQQSPVDLWLTAGAAVLGAAVCEEFTFRGVVQQGFSADAPHAGQGVVRAALIFGLFHFNPVNFVALFEIGVFLGLLFRRSGSLVPGIVAHGTQNALVLAVLLRERDLPPSAGEEGWRTYVGLGGMGMVALVMLLLFARRFPAVWGRPRPVPAVRERVPLTRAFAPWLVAASALLLAWSAVDRRGIELGVADLRIPVPLARDTESEALRVARAKLDALRLRVRTGQAPLREYLESRRALAESLNEPTPMLQRAK